jgi:hypothetical protein
VGKYLDILRARRSGTAAYDINDINDQSLSAHRSEGYDKNDINDKSPPSSPPFGRINRLCRSPSALAEALGELERRCPNFILPTRWQQAVKDGHRFLSRWGEQADALGWTVGDLFGLHEPPAKPHPSYSRLSRYDCTGLVWLLDGRSVVALTVETATIKAHSGSILSYRRREHA